MEDQRQFLALASLVPVAVFAGLIVWFFAGGEALNRSEQLSTAVETSLGILGVAVGVGVGSMAIVQFRKVIGRTRGRFHVDHLGWVLANEDKELRVGYADPVTSLDMPLEQVIALIASRAEQELAHSTDGGPVVRALVDVAGRDRVELPHEEPYSNVRHEQALLRESVERGLDSLHIGVRSIWRYRIRLEAALVAGGLGLGVVFFTDLGPATKSLVVGSSVLVGGFFAWLSRDVVAGIERWRDR